MMMLPVVGEEVLVGFEHDDTTRPYVLGSLFNGLDTPGDDLLQSKDGSFSLLSDHKFNVASKEDMTIQSQGKLTITVSNDTSLKVDQGNLNIEAQSVSIKADQDLSIEGNTQLTLTCGSSQIQLGPSGVTLSGPMISLG
jgi:uncharacterized protein involved in type VI secretion and phage assembly